MKNLFISVIVLSAAIILTDAYLTTGHSIAGGSRGSGEKTETVKESAKPEEKKSATQQVTPQTEAKKETPQPATGVLATIVKYWKIALACLAVIVLIGILLSFKERAVIFRDYDDLLMVFISGFVPFIIFSILVRLMKIDDSPMLGDILLYAFYLFEAIMAILILIRTHQDNQSIIITPIAFITKITLSILFLMNLIGALSPGGKNASERAKNRAGSIAWLLMLAPLMAALVKNKEGYFTPDDIIKGKGIKNIKKVREAFK